uniref:Secreted protein n=1 Tax=Knipowitschia caucasica TaxID=637954 RepID=A0AAV2JGA9_KNICA
MFMRLLLSPGQFLWVNSTALGGLWVISPWLWGGQGQCSLDMAVYLHPRQSGHYTIRLIERDKAPLVLFSTDTLPRITGPRLQPAHAISAASQSANRQTPQALLQGETSSSVKK